MTHEITVVPNPKMDTPGLYTWKCSCGRRSMMVGSVRQAEKAGGDHAIVMNAKDAR